ncbi:DUF1858 domain-containing protein [Psychrilyobacter atlanticus]|uniref:DUF1858 domain-containing protein n=1 Tax=Psychrilyobacter atlanticus TaxID=271091 RepID=UPI0004197B10|nr:DUF1858 domain-containing protein [Psychrilyobacter atlanticus]
MMEKDLFLKMNIQDLFTKYPFVTKIFEKFGLKCSSCTFSKNVSLEDALQSSGLPSNEIVEEIIESLEGEGKDEGVYTGIHW